MVAWSCQNVIIKSLMIKNDAAKQWLVPADSAWPRLGIRRTRFRNQPHQHQQSVISTSVSVDLTHSFYLWVLGDSVVGVVDPHWLDCWNGTCWRCCCCKAGQGRQKYAEEKYWKREKVQRLGGNWIWHTIIQYTTYIQRDNKLIKTQAQPSLYHPGISQ